MTKAKLVCYVRRANTPRALYRARLLCGFWTEWDAADFCVWWRHYTLVCTKSEYRMATTEWPYAWRALRIDWTTTTKTVSLKCREGCIVGRLRTFVMLSHEHAGGFVSASVHNSLCSIICSFMIIAHLHIFVSPNETRGSTFLHREQST